MKHLRWSFLLTVFNRWLFLQNTSYYVFHRVMNMPLIKLNKILVCCHLYHKNLGLKYVQISSTFKFNFIFIVNHKFNTRVFDFKLIHPCSWIHMILISHYLPVQTHHNNYRSNFSNFFGESMKLYFHGESKEIQSKLHSIVLTLW